MRIGVDAGRSCAYSSWRRVLAELGVKRGGDDVALASGDRVVVDRCENLDVTVVGRDPRRPDEVARSGPPSRSAMSIRSRTTGLAPNALRSQTMSHTGWCASTISPAHGEHRAL
jgi:hypothetical protein